MVNYHLGDYDASAVQPAHTLLLTDTAAEYDLQTETLRAVYSVGLPAGAAAALLPYPVIYAGAQYQLASHSVVSRAFELKNLMRLVYCSACHG